MAGWKWKRSIAAAMAGITILAAASPAAAMDLGLTATAADDSHRLETDAGWNNFLAAGGVASEMNASSAYRLDSQHSSCVRTYYEDKVPATKITASDLKSVDDLQTEDILVAQGTSRRYVFSVDEYVLYRTDATADADTGAIAAEQRPTITYENVYIYDPDNAKAMTEGLPGFVRLDLKAEIRIAQSKLWDNNARKTDYTLVGLERDFVGIPGVTTMNCAQTEIKFTYYYHGSGTAYTVHSNQTYSDIDAAQGIGIRAQNVSQRYAIEKTNILGFYQKGSTDIIQSTISSSVNDTPESAYGFTYDSTWIVLTVISGQHSGSTMTLGSPGGSNTYIGTSAYSLALPEVPEPYKSVSDTDSVTYSPENGWIEGEDENTVCNGVGSIGDPWTYTISQYIPEGMNTDAFYYQELEFSDQIPEQLEVQSVTVTDLAGTDRSSWFTISTENNEVTAKATDAARTNALLYGRGNGNLLSLNITVKIRDGVTRTELKEAGLLNEDTGLICFTDIGTVHITNAAGGKTYQNTNQVETYLQVPTPEDPQKTVSDEDGFVYDSASGTWSEGAETGAEENAIRDPASVWTYEISQKLPEGPLYFEAFQFADELDPRLEVRSVKIEDASGTDRTAWFDITLEGTGLQASAKAEVLAGADFYQTENYRMLITAGLTEAAREALTEQITVSNTASVMIDHIWKASNEVITRIDPPKEVVIRLTKKILASEIHFDHGTPVFLMKVSGTDLKEQEHTYYAMLSFDEAEIEEITGKDGFASKTAEFTVPAGVYSGSEEQCARYRLTGISDVKNGVITGSGREVRFDLTDIRIEDAACTFENHCFEYQYYSDSSAVENKIPGTD